MVAVGAGATSKTESKNKLVRNIITNNASASRPTVMALSFVALLTERNPTSVGEISAGRTQQQIGSDPFRT